MRYNFIKRIGPNPHIGGNNTPNFLGCPDIWELSDGSFAVIGKIAPKNMVNELPQSASCGPDESIVILPRNTLIDAKDDIPSK